MNVKEKSIIIIGGGLTGLSAGCYGRMNGYRTSIFEMHSIDDKKTFTSSKP
jgi:glycerol-3-phosphate dehydrogenase